MKYFSRILLFCFVSVVSCTGKYSVLAPGLKAVKLESMEDITSLERERLEFSDSVSLLGAVAIYDIGEGNVIVHMMAGDYCFRILDLKTGKSAGVLRRGRGPGEMPDAGFCSSWKGDGGNTIFSAYSLGSAKYIEIDLTESLSLDRTVIVSETALPANTMYVLNGRDGLLCYVISPTGTIQWMTVSKRSEIIDERAPFLTKGMDVQGSFFGPACVSEDGGKLVMGMSSFPRLFIFDNEPGKGIAIAAEKYDDKTIVARLRNKEQFSAEYYRFVCCKDEKIYAMYMGGADGGETVEPVIQVFDFDGRLQETLKIQDSFINFMVCDGGKNITGITIDGDIVRYTR